ncbi:hypothetical protein D3C81_1610010 [compost metagenome]
MQGNGHRFRGVVQDSCGPVALMHVAIEDQHPVHPTTFQQVMADHCQIIEDAEAGRVVVVRMMGAARQVTGQAMFQRLLGRQQRAADCAHRAPGQGFAPGQAEATLVFAGQIATHVALDIRRVMGEGENVCRTQIRAQQVGVAGQAAVHQVIAQQAELVHGEAVIRRKLGTVVFVINQRQWHGHFM